MEIDQLKINKSKLENIKKYSAEQKKTLTGYPSKDRPWLQYYSEEAKKISIPECTAYNLVYNKMKKMDDLIAVEYLGHSISYKKLFINIEKVAKSFREIGIKAGDVVTLAMPTSPELIYSFYALNRLGAIANCIDPRLTSSGFEENINSVNSKYLVSLDMCAPIIEELNKKVYLNKIVMVSAVESAPLPIKLIGKSKSKKLKDSNVLTWDEFISIGKNKPNVVDKEYEKDYPALIVHTGGTTGKPKGVVLTNDNFNAMAFTQEISDFDMYAKDTMLTFLPPFIAYCVVNAIHDPLYMGFRNIIVPKFDPNDFPKLMKKYRPNHVLAGPILWDKFIKDQKIKNEDLSYLKSPISGGDALNIELEREVNKFFKSHGCKNNIVQGYGMTEVSAAAIYSKPISYKEGSVGIPYVKNNVGIFDVETGKELKYGEEGEICISTPTMMKEYLNNPEATEKIIEIKEDGSRWIHTGDMGTMDEDGHLFVKGRIKRMIVRNGNKIFPSEVENIIKTIPEIDMCTIVQMDNEEERHVPVAHIVVKDEYKGMEEEFVKIANEKIEKEMPEFNVPYLYVFRDEIPLTNIQKVDFKNLEKESKKYVNSDEKIIYNYSLNNKEENKQINLKKD